MPILNYTTTISAERSVAEIQKRLVKFGAQQILTEYNDDGELVAVSFRVPREPAMLTFRLPARVDNIYVMLQRSGSRVSRKHRTREHAARVAWRIIKDWIEAQIAIIEAEQVELTEVFLPYLQDEQTGQTLYQRLAESGFKRLGPPG